MKLTHAFNVFRRYFGFAELKWREIAGQHGGRNAFYAAITGFLHGPLLGSQEPSVSCVASETHG